MRIEVITPKGSPNIDKGNLLEELAKEFLQTQGYKVTEKVRTLGAELDLYCTHQVSGQIVYVECKAHRDPLPADVLTKLLGTVNLHDYSEGWLVSTGPLGKDANGIMIEWEKKGIEIRKKLSIYTPDRVLSSLLSSNLIVACPIESANSIVLDARLSLGEWTLIISQWGKYWACPILHNGIAKSSILFCANKGQRISSPELLEKIKTSDSSFADLEFLPEKSDLQQQENIVKFKDTAIVEVEFGEKWSDYRPARPEHFVGRKKAQRELLQFFSDIKKGRTDSRIFAVKGDSGIGKSSLIAKMRDVAKKSHKPGNLFLYAVDMRAANDATYISSALLRALKSASTIGFGSPSNFEITNYTDPLQSDSIIDFLAECKRKHQLIILVIDQFEELYSKSELFSVFEEAKKLMFSTISAATNFALGFAWKTDSTVPQDHPAYHMWHQLSDHRFEILLTPFSHVDAEQSLNIFGMELGEKIRPELKKYLLENSQGYPWLLKKLCIHFYEQLQSGISQHQLANQSFDISSLFDRDLSNLTDAEMGCLKLVAQNAPMDWYEVLESAGHEVVQSLQNKRLLIRRGDKLNLYWDIFRDYVLYRTIPTIPFTYIPQSPSLDALIRVSMELDDAQGKTLQEIALNSKLEESTVRNILHDLDQFGVVMSFNGLYTLDNHLIDIDARSILSSIRILFKRHSLTDLLKKYNTVKKADTDQIIAYLKHINPTAQYRIRTWNSYAKRMALWLRALGLALYENDGILYKDFGDISTDDLVKWKGARKRILFLGDTSPIKTIEALDILKEHPRPQNYMKKLGYRNACAILYRFGLIELVSSGEYQTVTDTKSRISEQSVWEEALKEDSILQAKAILLETPSITPEKLGERIAENFQRDWKPASWKRIGRGLQQWSVWLTQPLKRDGSIPRPPGRRTSKMTGQLSLFSMEKM